MNRECPYKHPTGSRCPNCSDWPYAKGGALRHAMEDMRRNPPRAVVVRNLSGFASSCIGGPLVILPWFFDLEIWASIWLAIAGAFFLKAAYEFYKSADEIYEREYEILRKLWEEDDYGR